MFIGAVQISVPIGYYRPRTFIPFPLCDIFLGAVLLPYRFVMYTGHFMPFMHLVHVWNPVK